MMGLARRGAAGHGVAGHGGAGQGRARHGKAWQGTEGGSEMGRLISFLCTMPIPVATGEQARHRGERSIGDYDSVSPLIRAGPTYAGCPQNTLGVGGRI